MGPPSASLARFAALLLLVPLAHAAEIHVPGDFDDLQAAIDAASPGDTVVVHGGTWGPIVIATPLQIVGDPAPLIVGDGPPFGSFDGPITLAGPGNGTVTLSNLNVGGTIHGFFYSHSDPGIGGGGFDALHVHDCEVRAPDWEFLTGIGVGEPAIDVSTPFVLVERSILQGSASKSDPFSPISGSAPPGSIGLRASGTVLLLDSTVRGGSAGPYFHNDVLCSGGCPPYGTGGTGVVCEELHHAASTIEGGEGADWFGVSGGFCCTQPDGVAMQVNGEVQLANDLVASGSMQMGATYSLDWSTAGPTATLFWSLGADPPMFLSGLGYVYLDAPTTRILGPVPSPSGFSLVLPLAPSAAGLEVGFQVLDHGSYLSRPVFGTLLP